jgi:hypothetical protein
MMWPGTFSRTSGFSRLPGLPDTVDVFIPGYIAGKTRPGLGGFEFG